MVLTAFQRQLVTTEGVCAKEIPLGMDSTVEVRTCYSNNEACKTGIVEHVVFGKNLFWV